MLMIYIYFILAKNFDELTFLQKAFKNNSVLNFTHELTKDNNIPFLDVLIDTSNDTFTTSVYKKPTSDNNCTLNYLSECPIKYKRLFLT